MASSEPEALKADNPVVVSFSVDHKWYSIEVDTAGSWKGVDAEQQQAARVDAH